MNTASDENSGPQNVSTRVSGDALEEFDRTIKKAQIEGEIPMDVSRAKVIRGLMLLATEDTELISQAVDKESE